MSQLSINGTSLHVEQTGAGEPTLLFVHGMCGGGWVWEDQVARLSDRFRCISYDRRGHSRSAADSGDHAVATHAEDLAALIEDLELDRPVVVASSGGALVTLELLHRRQDLVGGAVLSEPPAMTIHPPAAEELMAAIEAPVGEAMTGGGPAAALEAFLGVVAPGLWAGADERRRAHYRANAHLLVPTLQAAGASFGPADMAAITVPVRVVTGAESPPALRSLARRLADLLPDARMVELPDAGHATYVDQPALFADTAAEFAADLATRAGAPSPT